MRTREQQLTKKVTNQGLLRRLKELLTDSATYGVGDILGRFVSFLLVPLYTRALSPSDYGVLAMLGMLSSVLVPVGQLGVTNAVFRRFNLTRNEIERSRVLGTGLASVLATASLMLLAVIVFAPAIARHLLNDSKPVFEVRLVAASAAVSIVSSLPMAVLRVERRVRALAATNLVKMIASIGATVALVLALRAGVKGVLIGAMTGEAVGLALFGYLTYSRLRITFDFSLWRDMLGYGAPFVVQQFEAALLGWFGQLLVATMIGLDSAGIYDIALKFSLPLTVIIQAMQRAWVPLKFQIHAEDAAPERVFSSLMTYYFAGTMFIWLATSVWSVELLHWVTPKDYHGAETLIPFVATIPLCRGLFWMFSTGYELDRDTRALPLAGLFGLLVTGAFGPFLTLHFESRGAAIAPALGWLAQATVMYWLARKRLHVPYDWLTLTMILGCAVGLVSFDKVLDAHGLSRTGLAILSTIADAILTVGVLLASRRERSRVRASLLYLRSRIARSRA